MKITMTLLFISSTFYTSESALVYDNPLTYSRRDACQFIIIYRKG